MGPTSPLDKHAGEAGGGHIAGHLVDQQMLGGWVGGWVRRGAPLQATKPAKKFGECTPLHNIPVRPTSTLPRNPLLVATCVLIIIIIIIAPQ